MNVFLGICFLALVTTHLSGQTITSFVHPGALHTQADLNRMAQKVAAQAYPWINTFNNLKNDWHTASWEGSHAQTYVSRGTGCTYGGNYADLYNDVAATYDLALMWAITGNHSYADQAVGMLNSWANTLQGINGAGCSGHDYILLAGIQGYQFANAAEILRTYSGWSPAAFNNFTTMMTNVFYPVLSQFPRALSEYANWDLCLMAGQMAYAILTDNTTVFNYITSYFKTGWGNGAISQSVYYMHPGYLGQVQEAGRDQGHDTLDIAHLGVIAQMAWNQGVDLYGYGNNRLLAGAEYVAKGNLQYYNSTTSTWQYYSVPFATYAYVNWPTVIYNTGFNPYQIGCMRPVFTKIYHHYVNIKGLAAPYTQKMMLAMTPDGSGATSGGYDQLGFESLTFTLDPISQGAPPSGLVGHLVNGQVVLYWWGSAYATSYNVKRGTVSGGPYTTIATNITDPLVYYDNPSPGIYYYVVTVNATGTVSSSEVKVVANPQALWTYYAFDQNSVSSVDSSGNGNTATLVGGAAIVPGIVSNAVSMSGNGSYVSLPVGIQCGLSDFTITAWVYMNSISNWMRLFDFGFGEERYMFFTVQSGSGSAFQVTLNTGSGVQGISGAGVPTKQWTHVTVSLLYQTATIFFNGTLVGYGTGIWLSPFQTCNTTDNTAQNAIGLSQFPSDPHFNGLVDDFKIYQGGLRISDIISLDTTSFTAVYLNGSVTLLWNEFTFANTTSYNVSRASSSSGPYTTIASGVTTFSYVDLSASVGTYYYIVTVKTTSGVVTSLPAKVVANPVALNTYLNFNQNNGSVTVDQSGNGNNGVLNGNANITTTGLIGNAISLDGSSGYVSLPAGLLNNLSDFTIATWVKLNSISTWARLFDFGYGTSRWIMFTPLAGSGYAQFEINVFGQTLTIASGIALPVGVWNHVAITLTGLSGTLYINGTLNGASNVYPPPFQVAASALTAGLTAQNWIGKSQYAPPAGSDPYLNGTVDDFRIYQGALTGYQVASLSSFNLNGVSSNGNIYLFWYGFANSSSFTIERSTVSGGPYTVIAANVTNQLSYTDSGLAAGTYYYVAVAGGVTSNQVKVVMSNPIVVNTYLTFDQTSGTVAVDSSGNGNNASLVNNATFAQGYINNAVFLNNNNNNGTGYVSLPTGFYNNLADFSITVWVNIYNLTNWMRVFDFGYGNQRYFMFTPSNANGVATFTVSLNGFTQSISAGNALPTQEWVHLAVTLSGTTGSFYVNGYLWAQGTIQIAPYQIAAGMSGITANNWIGRSQNSAPVGSDPYFAGLIDDFRIYSAALPANTIINLAQFSEMDTYLTFGQVNGTLVLDQSGNGNNGQLEGNANITTGIVNSAVSLDGSSGYVLLPSNLIFNSLDFTIAAWVYVRSVATWARVFDFGYGTNAWMFFTVKGDQYTGNNVALFRISNYSNNAYYNAYANQALPANQWVHVAVVMQTQTVTIYLNGTASGSTTGVPLAPYQLYPYAAAANYIGRSQWPSDPYLNGIIDDFRIYQGALSPLQINEIANPTVLNTYYTFDQNNGTLVATDSSVNGHTGTLEGNYSFVKGISNNAISLDGSSGYVLLPAGIEANLVDFTVATWVYARSTPSWARIFDFGFGTSSWMMFTVNGNSNLPAFTIVNYGGTSYTVSANKAFPTNQWVHVAVTLTGEIGTVYFNGTVVGNATNIPISPFQLFDVATAQNYIGKSQYAPPTGSDPYFNGLIDDFRFYQGALTQTQINALIALVG